MDEQISMMAMGGTGSGKTVALCCTYTHMTFKGGVKAQTPDGRNVACELVAKQGYNVDYLHVVYADMMTGAPLPNNSDQNRTFEFILKINGAPACDICYMDYPGGITRVENATEKAINEFYNAMKTAGILIYIIPGDILGKFLLLDKKEADNPSNVDNQAINREIDHIKSLMLKADACNTNAPILYYVTKADKVPYTHKERIITGLEQLIKEWGLQPKSRKVLGCYSTLGWDVYIDENDPSGHVIKSGFAPEGFEIPMLLTTGYRMSSEGKLWAEKRLANIQRELEEYESDKDEAIRKMAKESVGFSGVKNKLLSIIGRESKVDVKQQEVDRILKEIEKTRESIHQVDSKNKRKKHSADVLAYLNTKYPDQILYLDEKGEKKPLARFFE